MSSRPSFNYYYERLNNNVSENCSTLSIESSNNNSYSNGSTTNNLQNLNDKSENIIHHGSSNGSISKHHSGSSSGAHHLHSSSTASATDIILSKDSLVQLSFRHLIQITVALPLVIFIFNILYVLYVDFDKATNTVCNGQVVRNSLPSFSSVIGQFNVAKSLWGIAIALHTTPRFLFAAMIYSHLTSITHTRYHRWAKIAAGCNLIENIGLIVLSYVPSNVHFPIHMWSFISFLAGSELFMIIYCTLLTGKKYRNIPIGSGAEANSIRTKKKLLFLNIACTILSTMAYYRHVAECEGGVYTLFAFFEYIVVFTNMGFHLTAYWDFNEKILRI